VGEEAVKTTTGLCSMVKGDLSTEFDGRVVTGTMLTPPVALIVENSKEFGTTSCLVNRAEKELATEGASGGPKSILFLLVFGIDCGIREKDERADIEMRSTASPKMQVAVRSSPMVHEEKS
jgi:hypothetical protein